MCWQGKFSSKPSVFLTSEHHQAGLKRDAASVWAEDVTTSSFKVCLRELQNYDGLHEDIHVVRISLAALTGNARAPSRYNPLGPLSLASSLLSQQT